MRALVFSCLVASRWAFAAPAAPQKEEPQVCQRALKAGRALEAKKDWKGAIAAFRECLATEPMHARALSELGWAAYSDKDLPSAALFTERAIAAAGDDTNLKGASLYNLGLIAEARGDKPAAIAAYVASLKARSNGRVLARLATLDPAQATALDPFTPQPMTDPVPSLEAFCKAEVKKLRTQVASWDQDYEPGDVAKMSCACKPVAVEHGDVKKPPAPYLAVRVFQSGCDRGGGMSEHGITDTYLAVRTAAGWFVEGIAELENAHYCGDSLKVDALKVSDVIPGGAPEIVLEFSQSHFCRHGETTDSALMRVAGIGPSGKPSVTTDILLSTVEGDIYEDEKPKRAMKDQRLSATFDKDGKLVIANISGLRNDPSVGVHTLVFP